MIDNSTKFTINFLSDKVVHLSFELQVSIASHGKLKLIERKKSFESIN